MIADTFYNSACAGVTDTEPLSCHTVDERLTTGCTIERHISDNDIFICCKVCILRRINNNFTTGKPLAKIIVAVTAKCKRQSLRNKGTKALAACALTMNDKGIVFQGIIIFPGNFCTEQRTQTLPSWSCGDSVLFCSIQSQRKQASTAALTPYFFAMSASKK